MSAGSPPPETVRRTSVQHLRRPPPQLSGFEHIEAAQAQSPVLLITELSWELSALVSRREGGVTSAAEQQSTCWLVYTGRHVCTAAAAGRPAEQRPPRHAGLRRPRGLELGMAAAQLACRTLKLYPYPPQHVNPVARGWPLGQHQFHVIAVMCLHVVCAARLPPMGDGSTVNVCLAGWRLS